MRLVVGWLLAWIASCAWAQPAMLDVPPIERSIREAYRSEPLAERVEFTVRDARGAERTDTIELRAHAGEEELALRMGGLRVWASDGEVRVADAPDAGRVWSAELGGAPSSERLAVVLPPLVLPQLSSAFGDATPGATTLTPSVRWAFARRSARSVRLVGRDGPIAVTGVVADGRWRRWTATHETEGWSIELRIRSIAEVSSEEWRVMSEGRTPVATLAELRPAPSAVRLATLDPLPLMTMAGRARSWGAHLRTLEPDQIGVILLYRGDDETEQARRRAIEIVGRLATSAPDARVWPVAVFPLAAFQRDRLVAESARWDRKLREGDRLLWSVGLDGTLGRFDANATLQAIAIDRSARVWVSLPVRDNASVEELTQQVVVAARAHRDAMSP
ncbi:MAG: hypothetical protein AAGK04_03985 [Planctomycetota bacterium]